MNTSMFYCENHFFYSGVLFLFLGLMAQYKNCVGKRTVVNYFTIPHTAFFDHCAL